MQTNVVEMTIGVSLILNDVTNALLYTKVKTEDGNETYRDRDLPFRIRYRLNKNRVLFDKDSKFVQERRLLALARFGEPSDDGQNVVIKDPQKLELFKQEMSQIMATTVSHAIIPLEPEDLDLVTDTDIVISPDAMALFIGYMTNDPELVEDYNREIRVAAAESRKTQIEETSKKEEPVKTEEAPVKKTTVKKTSTTKKSTTATEATSTEKKTTTTKKTRTKKTQDTKES